MDFKKIHARYSAAIGTPEHADVPEILYHYTDAGGLFGMLQHGRLWATEYRYLNDRTELQHTRSLVDDVVTARLRQSPPPALTAFYAAIQEVQRTEAEATEMCLFSLSEEADSLSQWRSYARDGLGFTIGFGGLDLAGNCAPDDAPFGLARVEYDRAKQVRTLELILRDYEQELGKSKRAGPATIRRAASSFDDTVWYRAIVNKHHSFREEKEWRIFSFPNSETKQEIEFRSRGPAVIPFVELQPCDDRDRLPIRRIGIGPGHTGPEQALAVKLMCKKFGYDVEVYYADTPYRRT